MTLILALFLLALLLGAGSLAAAVFFRTKASLEQSDKKNNEIISLNILIPAHNEENKIEVTLNSIAKSLRSTLSTKVILLLDSCTDGTRQRAMNWKEKHPQAHFSLEFQEVSFKSKWKTLRHGVMTAEASDWTALVDAGSIFSSHFFSIIEEYFYVPQLSFVSPSYRMLGSSKFSIFFWRIESILKTLENQAGGPVSVHGAAIFYRSRLLKKAFEQCKIDFRNDDVILPLLTRIHFSTYRGLYIPNLFVFDQANLEKLDVYSTWLRRKRMVLGNIEWTRFIFNFREKIPFSIRLVMLRRMLRPYWFEILILLACTRLGTLMLLPALLAPQAALASLYAPFAFLFKLDQKKSVWRSE